MGGPAQSTETRSSSTISQPPPPASPQVPIPTGEEACERLVEVFKERNDVAACNLLCELATSDAIAAVEAALAQLEWAAEALLRALHHWPREASRNAFYMLLGVTVKNIEQHAATTLSTSVERSALAGSLMLSAFGDARPYFVASFVKAFRVATADVEKLCSSFLKSNVTAAVTVLDVLDARHLIPLELVINAAIKQKDFHGADLFVDGNKDDQLTYVKSLIERRVQDKIIRKRMVKFNIDEGTIPAFFERRMCASIRYLIYERNYEEALQVVGDHEQLRLYAAQFVLDQLGSDNMITRLFIHRAGVASSFSDISTSNLDEAKFPDMYSFEPLPHCLSLPDLIGEENCVFVDTPNLLAQCLDHLRHEPIIGFDCEWKATTSSAQKASEACAVMQLASSTRAFVVDMIQLKPHLTSLIEIFKSPNIMKLGFDAKEDLHVLNSVLPTSDGPLFENLVDIQALAKQLNQFKTARRHTQSSSMITDEVEDGEIADQGSLATLPSARTEVTEVSTGGSSKAAARQQRKRRPHADVNGGGSGSLSLAAVADEYLGKPLDKRARMSNWEQRPLSTAQLHYAALDAYVLVAILSEMRKRFPAAVMESALAKAAHSRGAKQKQKKRQSARGFTKRQSTSSSLPTN